jgi:acyl transferase domain-containing protein/NAD(P)-dependent dehydrogenase (short-subunit alcohol dehydrogenase family)/acyl carrier protein
MASNDVRKGKALNSSDLSPPVPVAIIGMGCMFPQAETLARYWANIRKGVDSIVQVPETHWQVADYFDNDPKAADRTYAHRGGFLTPVDFPLLDFGIAPNSVEATDTTQLLGLLVARQALADAGYLENPALDRDKVSVILGVTGTLELVIPLGARLGHPIWRRALQAAGVDQVTTEDVVRRIASSYVGWQEASFPGLLGNVAAGRIANRLDLRGTNCVVDAACASSLGAINLATLELAAGRCDLAVTGGLDTFNDIFMYMCFSKTPALSPTGDARPFDAEADGTILGEGLGVVILKRLTDAQRDGDRIYAVIRSIGSSSDGKGQAVYAPSAAGQKKALEQAYQLAGASPATVELLEAHGTGTKVGDAIELEALEQVYRAAGQGESWCALGSVKSQVGHTKSAAGAAGLIKAAMALYHKVLPPTLKIRRPIEPLADGASPFYLSELERPWLPRAQHPRRAAVSAFGFGGSNFHCVLEEADPLKPGIEWDGDVQILAYSSDKDADIHTALDALEKQGDWNQIRAEGSRSRAKFETTHRFRVVLVAERGQGDVAAACAAARDKLASLTAGSTSGPMLTAGPVAPAQGNVAIFVETGPAPGKLAMLFPGQGSQYVGMLRELACRFPQMQDALARANEARDDAQSRLSDQIYPPTPYDEATRQAQELSLRDTQIAQPAIGAISLGLVHVLENFGVRPDMTGGHSFGELTALCAAGRIDEQSFARLAMRRGEIMASCAQSGDRGAMLAVFAPLEQVATLVGDHELDLVIANKNAPRQCVLSGPVDEIERAGQLLTEGNLTARRVPVSAAFHSRSVASAETTFSETLQSIPLVASAIPVFSNATAAPYPEESAAARALLAGQLARPVEFVAQIEAMYHAGVRTFLEVGPDAKLTSLVRSIVEGREHLAVAVDAARGARGNLFDLACSLATLASVGYAVDLTRWEEGGHEPVTSPNKVGFSVKVCGANARPAVPARDETTRNGRPAAAPPKSMEPPAVFPHSPRISIDRDNTGIPISHHQPPDHTEIDWTMNLPERINSTHSNGKASSHAQHPREVAEKQELASAANAAPSGVGTHGGALSRALHNAQDNLLALQRLAEQTAALHRQFLEGQEKTQEIFLKLLDQQERLSFAAVDVHRTPLPLPEKARAIPFDVPSSNSNFHGTSNGRTPSSPPSGPRDAQMPRPTVERVPAAPIVTTPATPRPAGATNTTESATAILIDVVSEKTGYPENVLDLDMQLDADLGIDSIKRVEILSALQDRLPGLPALKPDQLSSFRTLRTIVEFVNQCLPGAPQAPLLAGAPSSSAVGDVTSVLLEVVADKTGYPAEMLELDMRLDADLGIDSIKRVEIFSAIHDRLPETPSAGPEQLGALGTLREIVAFLSSGVVEPKSEEVGPSAPMAPAAATDQTIAQVLLEAVADKTGYPIEMLELDMRLDTDLGIDSIKRVEILSAVQERLPRAASISAEQLGSLASLRQIVEVMSGPPTPVPHPTITAQNGRPTAEMPHTNGTVHHAIDARATKGNGELNGTAGALHTPGIRTMQPVIRAMENAERREEIRLRAGGTVWVTSDGSRLTDALCAALSKRDLRARVIRQEDLPGLVPDPRLCGLIVLAPEAPGERAFVNDAFRLIRAAGPALEQSAARGGAALLTVSRLEGTFGLAGLGADSHPESGALAGMAKTAGHEWREVHCKAVDLAAGFDSPAHAAELIVSELVHRGPSEVALTPEGRFVIALEPVVKRGLAERRPIQVERGDLVVISGGARGVTAEVALALAESFGPRLVLLGRTSAPTAEPTWLAGLHEETQIKRALLERSHGRRPLQETAEEARRILAEREIRHQLARIERAGSPVAYRSVDVRDAAAVSAVMAEIHATFGPVRGLIHGAGVLADRKISDQTDSQFELVYDTKVNGLNNLYQSLDPEALKFLILFSSSTARFGRSGQVAYAAANEVLNKWAQQQSVRLPHCRVVSYNWGPWAGGMVNDSLKLIFEKEGLALIPLDAGARLVADQVQSDHAGPVEIVVLAESPASDRTREEPRDIPAATAADTDKLDTVIRRTVDLDSLPVLTSHVIDHHAVLPMAMILEWLAEGAVHRNPGLAVCGVDNMRLYKGVIVGERDQAALEIRVGKAVRRDGLFIVPAELKGRLGNGREVAHAKADVVLADRYAKTPDCSHPESKLLPYSRQTDEVYHTLLFHGPAMQGIERIDGLGERSIAGWVATSPAPSEWLEQPLRNVWLTDPLAIDSAFQLVVLWCRDKLGSNSLPTSISGYRQFRRAFPAEGVRVAAEIRQASDARAVAEIEFVDAEGKLVARIDSYECVVDASLNQAFRRNRLRTSLTHSRAE